MRKSTALGREREPSGLGQAPEEAGNVSLRVRTPGGRAGTSLCSPGAWSSLGGSLPNAPSPRRAGSAHCQRNQCPVLQLRAAQTLERPLPVRHTVSSVLGIRAVAQCRPWALFAQVTIKAGAYSPDMFTIYFKTSCHCARNMTRFSC